MLTVGRRAAPRHHTCLCLLRHLRMRIKGNTLLWALPQDNLGPWVLQGPLLPEAAYRQSALTNTIQSIACDRHWRVQQPKKKVVIKILQQFKDTPVHECSVHTGEASGGGILVVQCWWEMVSQGSQVLAKITNGKAIPLSTSRLQPVRVWFFKKS